MDRMNWNVPHVRRAHSSKINCFTYYVNLPYPVTLSCQTLFISHLNTNKKKLNKFSLFFLLLLHEMIKNKSIHTFIKFIKKSKKIHLTMLDATMVIVCLLRNVAIEYTIAVIYRMKSIAVSSPRRMNIKVLPLHFLD